MVKTINSLKQYVSYATAIACACICVFAISMTSSAYAANATGGISGSVYEFDKGNHYEFSEAQPTNTDSYGNLTITGNVKKVSSSNAAGDYLVKSGNATITYTMNDSVFDESKNNWHIIEDKSKKVDSLVLEEDILSGAIIVQTSFDGKTWITDVMQSDVFKDASSATNTVYATTDIQIQNGCYYRVIVAYKMQRETEGGSFLFIETENRETKKVAEVYSFHAFTKDNGTTAEDTPKKYLGNLIKTEKDSGYSFDNPLKIEDTDPHFKWEIGKFFINGYTRDEKDDDGTYVFLKNVGDKVTLWFHLSQDINCLNGNENLAIAEDKNGYDLDMQIEKTNFKHGALIIRYTDVNGETKTLPPYFDYLAASVHTGADTRVQLFEEGDYEVVLDYEVKESTGPLDKVHKYHDYKVFFNFKIRNGNCMVFPFDCSTKEELSDQAITENGFYLDMANSKYLTIDVKREVIKLAEDGSIAKDVRFNRPAKDGAKYTDEGIYTFDVTNRYTGVHTTKTIYVGSSNLLKALSFSGLSVEDLNEQLLAGATIDEDGTIYTTAPVPEPESEQESEQIEEQLQEASETVELAETDDASDSNPNSSEIPGTDSEDQTEKKASHLPYAAIGIAAAGAIAGIGVAKNKSKKRSKNDTEEEDYE